MSGLCLTVGIDDLDRQSIPERILLRSVLGQAVETACRRSGFAGRAGHRIHCKDGICQVYPGEPARAAGGVPTMIREFAAAIANAGVSFRARLVLSTAPVLPPGIAGRAVIEGLRLVVSEQVGTVLSRLPAMDLAIVLSDGFYREMVERGLVTLRADECLPVKLGPSFPSIAWLHVPGTPRRSARPGRLPEKMDESGRATSSGDDVLVRARRHVRAGDHRRAIQVLEQALRLPSGLDAGRAESTLLFLGDCRLDMGDFDAAAQTWLFLLTRSPLNLAALHRLGRVAARQGRPRLAMAYLSEGLRLVRADPDLSTMPGRTACGLFLDMAHLEESLGNPAAADERLNQAAEADPSSPLPLVALAYRAARGGDMESARRLFDTAIVRVPQSDRKRFLNQQSASIATDADRGVIMELLLENDLDPPMTGTGHPSSALSEETIYGTRTVAEGVLPRLTDEGDPG